MHHNLFMSAENIGGSLLEEYVAEQVLPHGWIWCRGMILTAIDFCHTDCVHMFQVKNKTNTENSSSKGFREAHSAQVWHRMRASRQNGVVVTYWSRLVDLLRQGEGCASIPADLVSEEAYLDFVSGVASTNANLLSGSES